MVEDRIYEGPSTAAEIEADLRSMVEGRMGNIPPSEQAKVSPEVLRLLNTVKPGTSLYYATFNLRDEEDCFKVEQLLSMPELETINTSVDWSPSGEYVYSLVAQVPRSLYEELRKDYLVPPPTVTEEAMPPIGFWRSLYNRFAIAMSVQPLPLY